MQSFRPLTGCLFLNRGRIAYELMPYWFPSPYGVLIFNSSLRSALCRLAQKCILRRRWIFLCIGAVHVCKKSLYQLPLLARRGFLHPCAAWQSSMQSKAPIIPPIFRRMRRFLQLLVQCENIRCDHFPWQSLVRRLIFMCKEASSQNRHCENMTVPEVLCRRYNIFSLSIARL